MVAIANGISAYGLFIPFTATFLNFITYAFPAVRLSALSHLRQILVMTHDSIGLGEDGPTHQPVEVGHNVIASQTSNEAVRRFSLCSGQLLISSCSVLPMAMRSLGHMSVVLSIRVRLCWR
jgi:hypothetical protein